jgi:hypothetical protein
MREMGSPGARRVYLVRTQDTRLEDALRADDGDAFPVELKALRQDGTAQGTFRADRGHLVLEESESSEAHLQVEVVHGLGLAILLLVDGLATPVAYRGPGTGLDSGNRQDLTSR